MKVLKLTLENIEKIKNESDNNLVKRVCRYIMSNWEYYDDKKNIFLDVMKDGCRNGACCDLIYYAQTKRFYEEFKHEINELLYKSDYTNLSELLGDDWDKRDPLALDEDNQNLLAWFGFEETLTNIGFKFGIE